LRPKTDFQHFLAWVRATERIELFRTTPYFTGLVGYKDPSFGCEFEFDLTAIAQHYEFDISYSRNIC